MQRAGKSLEKVIARSLSKASVDEAPLLAWPLACGSAVAARTRALDCEAGILRVEVPDAGWRRELQVLAPQYVATLNRYVKGNINRVEFVVAGRKPASGVAAKKNSRSKRA
jgi:hypothetical protein